MSTITILNNEIFGNTLGQGYSSDVSCTDLKIREYLLKYTPKYEYGRPFYKNLEYDYFARYTMLQLPINNKHQFLSKNGRDGAYLGISMQLSNQIPDSEAIKMLNIILDDMRDIVYQELPNSNLQYLINDLYGSGLKAYNQAIEKYVKSFNIKSMETNPKPNIFETLESDTEHTRLGDYTLYKFTNSDKLATTLATLQKLGIRNYMTFFNNILAISTSIQKKYVMDLYENNSIPILEFKNSHTR